MKFQVERATKYQNKNGKYHPPTVIKNIRNKIASNFSKSTFTQAGNNEEIP